jgi:DNA-binding NarL/FixJ family response regulator
MDGVDATRVLAREHPDLPVVMMSAALDEHVVFAAGKAGASAYLSKHLEPDVLVSTIRAVVAATAQDRNGKRSFRTITGAEQKVRRLEGSLELLSRRETEVLEQIRSGRTNREIAQRLGVSQTTVNKHVHKVLLKLKARNRAQAATLLPDPLQSLPAVAQA